MILMPNESAKMIARYSKNVSINPVGIIQLAHHIFGSLAEGKISINSFSQSKLHPSPNDPKAVEWIFVLSTLNFSFWNKTNCNNSTWIVNGETGYFALCAAIKRAIEERKPIIDPNYYSQITRSEAEYIFRGDTEASIPLLDERVKCLREAGKVLLEKYEGAFVNCIKSCFGSAEELVKCVVKEFESYRDEANYNDVRVSFYKRAQILVGDLWSCFNGKGIGEFKDIDCITMFADYRVPQVLVHFGAIRYSNTLLSKLQSGVGLENGCNDEIEIRGCSISVVEQVKEKVRTYIGQYPNLPLKKTDINAIMIDNFLWSYRRRHENGLKDIPFHKTRCIYY